MKPALPFLAPPLLAIFLSLVSLPAQDMDDSAFQDDRIPASFSIDYYDVQSGEVSILNKIDEVQITASDGAVISYPTFDIPAGETVRFIQPSSEATVINQISGAIPLPTQIDGNIYATGKVVLLNPYGVVFGESAVVDVGKLHAIAGYTRDSINYTTLGEVTNQGKIAAGEVVLAGSRVTNAGTIVVGAGSLVLAAGGSVQLYNEDDSYLVLVSNYSDPLGVVSDVAGQALLQSGVLEATKAQLHGSIIENTGRLTADSLTVGHFDSFSGKGGTISTSQLSIDSTAKALSDSPSFVASEEGNRVEKIGINGSLNALSLRLLSSTQVDSTLEELIPGGDSTNIQVQDLDLRVDQGDLTIKTILSPVDINVDNSLLLAAENNLILSNELDTYNYARKIFYGRNLSAGIFAETELALGSMVSLDAVSVFMDDLSPTLSPEVIQLLAVNNPSFEGFDSKGGLLELSALSSDQLQMLFKYGLFTGYSYFLQAPTVEAVLVNNLEDSGFSSTNALFGGDFSIMASAGGGSDAGGSESSDSSDSSEESSSDSASSSAAGAATAQALRSLGASPFAPVGRPILSPEAALILENALTVEIESKLNQYLGQ